MSNLRFDYELLQELINDFESVRSGFEKLATEGCPEVASDDPVARHHSATVKGQSEGLLTDAMVTFGHAKEGTKSAHAAFKAADAVGGVE